MVRANARHARQRGVTLERIGTACGGPRVFPDPVQSESRRGIWAPGRHRRDELRGWTRCPRRGLL